MTIVQVAAEVDEVAGVPAAEWLRNQVDDAMARRATISDSCEPEPLEVTGASFAVMCVYDTEGVFVTTFAAASDPDTRTHVATLVELTNDGDEELSALEAAAEKVAGVSIAVIFS